MKTKRILSIVLSLVMILTALPLTAVSSFAVRSGDWSYRVLDDCTAELYADSTSAYHGYETNLIIPSVIDGYTVTSIGEGALRYNPRIVSVTIPSCITNIDNTAFEECEALENFIVSEGNTVYSSENGVLFNKSKTELIQYPQNKKDAEYIIPNSVTKILYRAFNNCTAITKISIPNSVVDISASAFADCTNLRILTLPDNITCIHAATFNGCKQLQNIKIPYGVTEIEDYAFKFCSSLTSIDIPNSVTSIGRAAFGDCDSLKSINIPDNVTISEWNEDMLDGCGSLENIYVGENNTSCTLVDGVLFNKDETKIIKYPASKSGTNFTIPESVKEIREFAFEYCYNLTSITVSSGNTNFCAENGILFNNDKTALLRYPCAKADKNYVIPDSVTDVGKCAFFDCSKLECLTISKNVKNLAAEWSNTWADYRKTKHYGAFDNNTALKKIIWNAEKCFLVCEEMYLDPESPDYYPHVGVCSTVEFFPECTEFIFGDTVKYIPSLILANNTNIESIIIPDNVSIVQLASFVNCTSLKNVKIGNSVTSIVGSAFIDCTSLASVIIPNSVTNIGYRAFDNCYSLEDVYYAGSEESWNNISIGEYNRYLNRANIHYNTTEDDYEVVESVPATCGEGRIVYRCPHGYEKTEWLEPVSEHNLVRTTVNPTCTQSGYTANICTVCGYEDDYTDWKSPLGHNFVNDVCSRCSIAVKSLAIGKPEAVNIEDGGDCAYYKITPNATGKFTVWSESNSDTLATLVDSDMNSLMYNDDGGEDYNFKITYYLEKGKTYYLECSFYDSYETGSFTLKSELEEIKDFPDVPSNAWFYEPIKFNVGMGYFKGYGDGTFGPGNNIQRQDFVVVLSRIAGVDLSTYEGQNGGMSDVPKNDYYSAAVAWAVDNNIITGYKNGKFGVGDPITREQVCAIFYRYMQNYCGKDMTLSKSESAILARFGDKNAISDWAVPNVAWAVDKGVISGTQSGNVNPAGNANRAEISKILMNMSNNGLI